MTLCSATNFSKTMIGRFIGQSGSNLYRLTDKLNVKYIWFDIANKQIEIWGPENKLVHAKKIVDEYIEQMEFLDTFNFNFQNKVVKVETRNQATNTPYVKTNKVWKVKEPQTTKQVWKVKEPQTSKQVWKVKEPQTKTKQVWKVKI
tara:strand:- start:7064 stop:7501 length:438 start_codon:yes stop_codon:yes gene_type:complete